MGLSRQEHWSGLPGPQGIFLTQGSNPSPMSAASAGGFLTTSPTQEIPMEYYSAIKKMEIVPFAERWMDLEMVILSEVSQTETNNICYLIS